MKEVVIVRFIDLMEKAQQGDKIALKELLRPYAGSIYQRALLVCRDEEKAKEITKKVLYEASFVLLASHDEAKWNAWINETASRYLIKENFTVSAIATGISSPEIISGNSTTKKESKAAPKEIKRKEARGNKKFSWGTIGIIVCVLIALWMIIGFAFAKYSLPTSMDWGYSWFNSHIYHLFVR